MKNNKIKKLTGEYQDKAYEKILQEIHSPDRKSVFNNALRQFDNAAAILKLTNDQIAIIKRFR